MVLLEAMACGLPIISFANEGAKAIIEHNKTGILVKSFDNNSLSSSIQKLIGDKKTRNKLSYNANLEAKKYNINSIGLRWEEVLNI